MQLTKNADTLLCVLYKEYLNRTNHGINISQAKIFGNAKAIQESFAPNLSVEDVAEICRELDNANYVTCDYADNTVRILLINVETIIYMENRFSNGINDVLNYLEKIKNILWPF